MVERIMEDKVKEYWMTCDAAQKEEGKVGKGTHFTGRGGYFNPKT